MLAFYQDDQLCLVQEEASTRKPQIICKDGLVYRVLGGEGLILLIRERAEEVQVEAMLQELGVYIKMAVDIERRILAGGGYLHADCEAELLDDGSRQEAIWGANWNPFTQDIVYESLINIRPRQNRSMEILDARIREQVAQVIQQLLGGLGRL